MHRVPAFLTVGVVAGLAGAGVMWLFTRGSGSAGLLPSEEAKSELTSSARIGVPRKFEPIPGFTSPEITPTPTKPSGKDPGIAHLNDASTKRATEVTAQDPDLPPVAGSGGIAALPAFSKSTSKQGIGSILETKPTTLSQKSAVPAEFADALAAARNAAVPHTKQGFSFREEYWAGTIEDGSKAVTTQLFRGNAYWFVAGTDVKSPAFEVHVFDSEGNLAEEEFSRVENAAAAHVVPQKTGTYYVIISHDRTRDFMKRRTAQWALLQGYR